MNIELLLTLTLIHCVALVGPGPDFALIIKLASQESRKVAVAAAGGIAVAILLHTLMSLTGVSLLIQSSQTLFYGVKILGSCYLTWMGIGAIKSAINYWRVSYTIDSTGRLDSQVTIAQGFMQGLYTNLLNPKAMIFFITLFSTMFTPQETIATKVATATIFLLLSLLWFTFIALILSKPKIQVQVKKATPVINLITGLVFVTVAVTIVSGLV